MEIMNKINYNIVYYELIRFLGNYRTKLFQC